jgi:hypothetical protein
MLRMARRGVLCASVLMLKMRWCGVLWPMAGGCWLSGGDHTKVLTRPLRRK